MSLDAQAGKALSSGNVSVLRALGYKVRVNHYRRYVSFDWDSQTIENCMDTMHDIRINVPVEFRGDDISPTGGKTVIELRTPEGVEYTGVVNCFHKDNYNRKLGVKLALNRIKSEMVGH